MARLWAPGGGGIGAGAMAEKHVVFALIERRARLAGELRAKQAEVLSLKRALASVDLCIRMFKADYQPESVPRK